MNRPSVFLAGALALLAGAAAAQTLGSSPQVISGSPAMPGAAPSMPGGMASPATPMAAPPPSLLESSGGAVGAGAAATTPTASAASGATAGIVGLRGAMIARKGTVYVAEDVGASTQAFMTIENQSNSPDNLTSVICTIADTTTIVGGDGKPLASVPVNPGKPLVLAANGVHVILHNLHYNIESEVTVPCSLNFQYAGAIQAYLFAVPKPAPTEP